jgi:hypothetical protein
MSKSYSMSPTGILNGELWGIDEIKKAVKNE